MWIVYLADSDADIKENKYKMSGESAAQFSEKVETIVKNGVTTVAFSIGAQMGFFDVMATFEDAFTPEELASKTNCKPV